MDDSSLLQNPLQVPVSLFEGAAASKPAATVILQDWLENGAGYPKDSVIAPAGVLAAKGADQEVLLPSGLLPMHFDLALNPYWADFGQWRLTIQSHPALAYSAANDNELRLLFAVRYPLQWKQHQQALQLFYLFYYGIWLQGASSSAERWERPVDKKPFINPSVAPFTVTDVWTGDALNVTDKRVRQAAIRQLLDEVAQIGLDLLYQPQHWFWIGTVLVRYFGEAPEGYQLFERVMLTHPGYSEEVCKAQYGICQEHKVMLHLQDLKDIIEGAYGADSVPDEVIPVENWKKM